MTGPPGDLDLAELAGFRYWRAPQMLAAAVRDRAGQVTVRVAIGLLPEDVAEVVRTGVVLPAELAAMVFPEFFARDPE